MAAVSSNVKALEETLSSLRDTRRLERVDEALVQGLRSMAGALDLDPSNAALWRQYRETLKELTADDSDGSVAGEIAALFAEVRDKA